MPPSSALEAIRALEERVARIERVLGSEILGAAVPLAPRPVQEMPVAPKPPVAKPRPERSGLELGTTWFARLGIGLLVVGFVLFANYLFKSFGPGEKAAFVYVVALLVGGLGLWLRRKYQDYGELLVGGAWAIAFFMTYALHAVDATRWYPAPARCAPAGAWQRAAWEPRASPGQVSAPTAPPHPKSRCRGRAQYGPPVPRGPG
jgi:uncharacterized membrane protein